MLIHINGQNITKTSQNNTFQKHKLDSLKKYKKQLSGFKLIWMALNENKNSHQKLEGAERHILQKALAKCS